MTQNEKELLLKDLCARLPYGVKAYVKHWAKLDWKYYEGVFTVKSVHTSLNDIIYASSEKYGVEVILGHTDYVIKPYLFPLSSMTEEQLLELSSISFENSIDSSIKTLNWCYKNHLDINNLIPMGLANDATGLNIY